MINHLAIQLALRAKLLTFPTIATTGSATLSATATGYARLTGSFITDGFYPGFEVAPSGFTQTEVGTVIGVTALALTIFEGRTVQSSASGRTLSVGLPSMRQWENVAFTPVPMKPFIEEQYAPGPTGKFTLGALGQLELLPMYFPRIHVPAGYDISAGAAYADTLLTLFAPGTAIAVGSDTLRVRGDSGPYRGQAIQSEPGFSVVPVNVPLRMYTTNSV